MVEEEEKRESKEKSLELIEGEQRNYLRSKNLIEVHGIASRR